MIPRAEVRDDGRLRSLELDPAGECPPDLARVLAYWEAKRQDRFAPRREDIDPADLVEVLPRIMLADVVPEPLDFRYRLSGTAIDDLHAVSMTGKGPRDLKPPAYGELIHAHYCEAVSRRRPLLHLVTFVTRRSLSYTRLLLPLSQDGASVTTLMTVDGRERDTAALRKFFDAFMGRE